MLVDLSEPVPGEVVDGSAADFTDLQFTTSQAKVELQWRDYYDPESNISHYDVKVFRAKFVFFFCSFNLQLNWQAVICFNYLCVRWFVDLKWHLSCLHSKVFYKCLETWPTTMRPYKTGPLFQAMPGVWNGWSSTTVTETEFRHLWEQPTEPSTQSSTSQIALLSI